MSIDLTTLSTREVLSAVYIGYYNRAADPAGIQFWEQVIANTSLDLVAVATDFSGQAETQAVHPFFADPTTSTPGTFITSLYQNLFNRDPDTAGLNFWSAQLQNAIDGTGTFSVGEIIVKIIEGAVDIDGGTQDRTTILNKIEVAQDWTDAAEAADGEFDAAAMASAKAIIADVTSDPATVAEAKATTDAFFAPAPVEGETILLTSATDVMTGTADNDQFNAYLQQNPFAGGISNSLSSADRLDGGAGDDSLYAELSFELFGTSQLGVTDIQPRIKNIEEILIEARDFNEYDDDELPFDTDETWSENDIGIVFDAKYVTDHQKIGSYFSDGDLKIENLTTLTSGGEARNTSDITVVMDHTDNFNSDADASDLIVLFDEDYLLSGQESAGEAVFFLLDQDAELRIKRGQDADGRLDEIDKNGIRVEVNGQTVEIEFDGALLAEDNVNEVNTHDEFIAALQAPLQQLIADGFLPAGSTIERRDYTSVLLDDDNLPLNQAALQDGSFSDLIPGIVFMSGDGSEVTALGYTAPDELTGEFNVFGRFDDDFAVEDQPISVNIELDKVGREGEGGDLVVGSKVVESSEGIGIEVFHVSVKGEDNKPSNLGMLATTNEALDAIYVETDAAFVDADSHASLTIRGDSDIYDDLVDDDDQAFGQNSLGLFDASDFLGDLTLGSDEDVDNLITLVADGGGDVSFNGDVTLEANHSILTGAGDDVIGIDLDGTAVDVIGTSHITNTGAGDDEVIVNKTGENDVSERTSFLLDNLKINTGSGEDYVLINDTVGRFAINAGSDSDFVEIDAGNGSNDTQNFGDDTGAQDFSPRVLYQADLTVMFAGFESTVRVATTAANNFVATQLDINAAIIAAVAANPELARLLTVTELDGIQQIQVASTVEGQQEFGVALYQPQVVDGTSTLNEGEVVLTSASDWNAVARGLIETGAAANSEAVDTATEARAVLNGINGSLDQNGDQVVADEGGVDEYDYFYDTTFGLNGTGGGEDDRNHSRIDMGDGSNDLLVMDDNALSGNTLEISQTFGKVSVVNFFTSVANAGETMFDEVGTVGNHALDFTAYLDNTFDPSDNAPNAWSVNAVPVELSGDGAGGVATGTNPTAAQASANSVSILSFDEDVANSVSFASVSAAQVVTALNTAAPTTVTGGLTNTTLSAIATTDLVGTVQDHIVMVENAQNLGEYKVFYLTSALDGTGAIVDAAGSAAGGDFATGTLLGTVDFGAQLGGFDETNLIGSEATDALTSTWLGL